MKKTALLIVILTVVFASCSKDVEVIKAVSAGFVNCHTDSEGYISVMTDDMGNSYMVSEKGEQGPLPLRREPPREPAPLRRRAEDRYVLLDPVIPGLTRNLSGAVLRSPPLEAPGRPFLRPKSGIIVQITAFRVVVRMKNRPCSRAECVFET